MLVIAAQFPITYKKEQGTYLYILCSFRHSSNDISFPVLLNKCLRLFSYKRKALSVAVVLTGISAEILAVISAGIFAGILTVVSAGIFAGILTVISARIFTGISVTILAVVSAGISAVFHIFVIVFHSLTS